MTMSKLTAVADIFLFLGYQMEHIIALSLATTTYNEIGEEFSGAPSSK